MDNEKIIKSLESLVDSEIERYEEVLRWDIPEIPRQRKLRKLIELKELRKEMHKAFKEV